MFVLIGSGGVDMSISCRDCGFECLLELFPVGSVRPKAKCWHICAGVQLQSRDLDRSRFTKAFGATIQALEVQRMNLSTLQSMNVGMADVAAAMTGKTAKQSSAQADAKPSAASSAVDPMQWWGAIGQQFQTIASQAVADMQKHASTFAAASDKATQPAAKKASASGARKTAATSAGKTRSKPRKNTAG